ncbi:MAG: copper-translocating P-type ATPase [Coriobacteriales bacterium]|nr:copper-translocating P-type ATPase [Coriobacteriales bacterium]
MGDHTAQDSAEHDAAEVPMTEHGDHGGHAGHADHAAVFRTRFWICLALTVPIIVISPMPLELLGLPHVSFPGDSWVVFGLATVIYFYGGWPFLTGLVDEVRSRSLGMMTLVAVGITTAYAYSAAIAFGLEGEPVYWELATLVDVMLLGHWIEMRSVMSASSAVEAIARLVPGMTHKLAEDGSVTDVPTQSLAIGDRVLVRPGERVPADGEVAEGASAVDESLLTGESMPVKRAAGDGVVGGSVNGTGSLTVVVTRTGEESFLSQVVRLVREAQESKSRTQRLADKAATALVFVALGAGLLTLVAWLVVIGSPVAFALERTVSVVVIACPHALGLAIPLVVAVSTALAAGTGVLIRDRTGFESAHDLDVMVFDKTGTLTEGRFGVTDVIALAEGWDREYALRVAAAVETHSEHPIAQAIVADAGSSHGLGAEGFESIPGAGARATVDGIEIAVVSPAGLDAFGIAVPREAKALQDDARTVAVVVADGAAVAAIGLADAVKPSAADAVKRLRAMGIEAVMLTGDNEHVAQAVGRQLGIDRVIAGVRPQDKAAEVQRLRAEGRRVGMTGDGVNDAPALAAADLGIAVGAGTDVAIQTADIVLVRSDPADVADVVELSRRTWRKMVQNLVWATGYNVIALPLAAGVAAGWGILLTPAVGAAFMAASTVVVAINARLLRMPRERG